MSLLDACALLWFLSNDPKLSATARTAIEEPANVRWISPGSLFEIAIKVRIGKLKLATPFASIFPAKLLAADIHLLPLESHHVEPSRHFLSIIKTHSTAWSPRPRWSRA